MPRRLLLAAAAALLVLHPALAAPPRLAPRTDPVTGTRTFTLWDGSEVSLGRDGVAYRAGKDNRGGRLFSTFLPPGSDDLSILRTLSLPRREIATSRVVPGTRPEFWGASMAIEPRALDAQRALPLAPARAAAVAGLPQNYGLRTSFQAHLNANGVNAAGAFADLARRFGQLPGQGVRVTNVSVGDLTDQSMADAGDYYVQTFGANSRVIDGQRYLDYASMPLIPTFVSDAEGKLDPLGTVEFVDPYQAEILLD